ncbi:hypothetical protein CRG98_011033 [Punica granatum]|uniref:Uncharacterized protein n=1 Tax=Punica granatum TaxID=22663 RepID=A0A2I0KJ42_PUNGR|nr:hypothetical protein CRG98_011033 [Punica granatum]
MLLAHFLERCRHGLELSVILPSHPLVDSRVMSEAQLSPLLGEEPEGWFHHVAEPVQHHKDEIMGQLNPRLVDDRLHAPVQLKQFAHHFEYILNRSRVHHRTRAAASILGDIATLP